MAAGAVRLINLTGALRPRPQQRRLIIHQVSGAPLSTPLAFSPETLLSVADKTVAMAAEAANIAFGIGAAALSGDGREAQRRERAAISETVRRREIYVVFACAPFYSKSINHRRM